MSRYTSGGYRGGQPAADVRPPLKVPSGALLPNNPVDGGPGTCADLVITVHGTPAPQGSKRHVGRGIMVESSKAVKPWREAVKHAALLLGPMRRSGALRVEVTFTLRKPASAPKRRTTWPQQRPDIDKLLRSTFDALSDAGVWVDDSQVVEVTARKVYPDEGVDALPHPGAVIRLWAVGT